MNCKILLLAFLAAVLPACKKKIPHDAVVNKMAGKHEWWGIKRTISPPAFISSIDTVKFSTVIYAENESTIMYYDSADFRMIKLNYDHQNISNQSVYFKENKFSSYNVIQYYYLKDSFCWERHISSIGVKWILHSP